MSVFRHLFVVAHKPISLGDARSTNHRLQWRMGMRRVRLLNRQLGLEHAAVESAIACNRPPSVTNFLRHVSENMANQNASGRSNADHPAEESQKTQKPRTWGHPRDSRPP